MNSRGRRRSKVGTRTALAAGLGSLVLAAACNVVVTEGDDPGEVIVRISNQVFGIEFGIVGVFDLEGDSATITRAAFIPLFEQVPDDRPAMAQLILPPERVQAVALGTNRAPAGAALPSGTGTLGVRIADSMAQDPCAEGRPVGTFELSFAGGDVSVARPRLDIPTSVLSRVTSGRFTMCLEARSAVDVQLVIDSMDVSFGPALDDLDDPVFVPDPVLDDLTDPVVVVEPDPGNDDTGTSGAQVPIDAFGNAVAATDTVDGIDYALPARGEQDGIMEVATSDAPPARWPSTIAVNLAELGLARVEALHFGTFTSFVPDLPNGLTVATLTCAYAEGGAPTVVNLILGNSTAEWSYDRIEHAELLGGVQHLRPVELFSFSSALGSRAPYTGYSYAGVIDLDDRRTLSCITLDLTSAAPYASLRSPTNPEPTWLTQTVSAITLIGERGTPPVIADGCTVIADAPDGLREVPIDAVGRARTPTDEIDGIDYTFPGDVLAVHSDDAPPSMWPDRVGIDLAELGLQSVEALYFGTHSAWAMDLPDGLTVATIVCEYAEGGSPETYDLVTGATTAEWSYDRIEHTELLGGVRHARPPELLSWTSTVDSRAAYTGYTYAGMLRLDPTRTLTCIRLELAAGIPFPAARAAVNPEPTWFAQTLSAVTLVGQAGTPAVAAAGCPSGDAGGTADGGFTVATIRRAGAEHLIAGQDVDPAVSLQTDPGYVPSDVAISGDGSTLWFMLFDNFPNVEGDPQAQLWSIGTDGSNPRRSTIAFQDAIRGDDARVVEGVKTNLDGSVAVVNDDGGSQFWHTTPGGAVEFMFNGYDFDGMCARGQYKVTDDGSTLIFGDNCSSRTRIATVPVGGATPQYIAMEDDFTYMGYDARGWVEWDMDTSANGGVWVGAPRVLNTDTFSNLFPFFVGSGLTSPSTTAQDLLTTDVSIKSLNITDDGGTIAYCALASIFESSPCYVQQVGSSQRYEISDGLSGLGNMVLADDGSKVYARAGYGFSGGWGFMEDLATGERWPSGSQRFSANAMPVFTQAEMSDDGSLLAAPVPAGVYLLHDEEVPAGFPDIDRVLYRYNADSCSLTVRVEVTAPLGVERIYTLPIYRGFDSGRTLDIDTDPLFTDRAGGGVNMSTRFTDLGDGVWEREIRLQSTGTACKRDLLTEDFTIRIVLVEATGSRTVFKDFTPVP